MTKTILKATDLAKIYHDGQRELPILTKLNLTVREGEVIAILGRSGTGKSTLLNILGLLDKANKGELELTGHEVGSLSESAKNRLRGKTIGFVFQHYHLINELTALDNVAIGASVGVGGSLGRHKNNAKELIESVGMSHRTSHKPKQLSGGEQQRIAIARALICEPSLLLCDEPTGNLDPQTGQEVIDVLWNIVKKRNMTMIMVTHDRQIAQRADRMMLLADGRLKEI